MQFVGDAIRCVIWKCQQLWSILGPACRLEFDLWGWDTYKNTIPQLPPVKRLVFYLSTQVRTCSVSGTHYAFSCFCRKWPCCHPADKRCPTQLSGRKELGVSAGSSHLIEGTQGLSGLTDSQYLPVSSPWFSSKNWRPWSDIGQRDIFVYLRIALRKNSWPFPTHQMWDLRRPLRLGCP